MSTRRIVAFLCAALAPIAVCAQEKLDPAPWRADLQQLITEMTAHYPNLAWSAQRGMDLAGLRQRTLDRIDAAPDVTAARRALTRFIEAFGDAHMSLAWSDARPPASAAAPAGAVCARLGYRAPNDARAIARMLPGYRALVGEGFVTSGMLTIGSRTVGVLRVPEFAPPLPYCEAALRTLKIAGDADCDSKCEQAVQRQADQDFVNDLQGRVRELAAARPAAVLVDVAANGGGNDTAIVLARLLSSADLPTMRMEFARTEARIAQYPLDIAELAAAARRARGEERAFLEGLRGTLAATYAQRLVPCDLAPVWENRSAGCTGLFAGSYFAGGLVSTELPERWRSRPWATAVSATAAYAYAPGAWTGPLLILVDNNSASATELFASLLQDAGRGTVVGSPTLGAGCGWTLPKHETVLAHSGGVLTMPDCTRWRPSGTNDLDGVQPDVLVGFRPYDSVQQRIQRLEPVLPMALERELSRAH